MSRDTLSSTETAELIAVAHQLADAARTETLRHFRARDLTAENKAVDRFDPVTVADRASEAAMREVLARTRPRDGILGEEQENREGTSGFTWVLDPIDGTRGYISGTPTWGVLIALADAVGPFFGVIDQPYIGERFIGGLGISELQHGGKSHALEVRHRGALSEATLFSTFPEIGTETERARFESVADEVELVRYGCDCYAYGLMALGQIDLVIEAGLAAYDIQAPIAVVEAAGGIVTNWEGGPAHEGGRALAAATPELHAAALELLRAP